MKRVSRKRQPPAMDGPFDIDVKVHITDGKGQVGTVTYSLPTGTFPTTDAVKKAVAASLKAASKQGFRLMNRHEFCLSKMGLSDDYAVPGPEEFAQ